MVQRSQGGLHKRRREHPTVWVHTEDLRRWNHLDRLFGSRSGPHCTRTRVDRSRMVRLGLNDKMRFGSVGKEGRLKKLEGNSKVVHKNRTKNVNSHSSKLSPLRIPKKYSTMKQICGVVNNYH